MLSYLHLAQCRILKQLGYIFFSRILYDVGIEFTFIQQNANTLYTR